MVLMRIIALASAGLVSHAAAETFLAKAKVELLVQEEVKQLLLAELSGHTDSARLHSIEEELRPTYAALPKSEEGRLEPAAVRYALHRYFMRKNGWSVKGLDSAGGAWNSSSGATTTLLKARAPAYILSLFQEHLHGKGMGLHELAVFAATLADLIHAEAVGQLEQIFQVESLPRFGPVQPKQADSAIDTFIMAYLLGGETVIEHVLDIQEMRERLEYQYANLNETKMFVQDLRFTHDLGQHSRRNPFVERPAAFDECAAFALQFGQSFGSFQNLECHRLKRKLVGMEHSGTGRVLLSMFYNQAKDGDWEFMESVEYLRNQGALDESDPEHPSVVTPNYINSRMNCLTASDFYAVCCLNECDGLLEKLELQIPAPSAEPQRIIEVVSGLQSDTVDAPRNLSVVLMNRLHEIAARSGSGLVPLHGRLFAQWLHHAYPRECPFPHMAGAVKPMYPEEWANAVGEENLEVSPEVLQAHVARLPRANATQPLMPWTFEEELVAEDWRGLAAQGTTAVRMPFAKACAAIVALVSFALPLVRSYKVAFASPTDDKLEKHLV